MSSCFVGLFVHNIVILSARLLCGSLHWNKNYTARMIAIVVKLENTQNKSPLAYLYWFSNNGLRDVVMKLLPGIELTAQ